MIQLILYSKPDCHLCEQLKDDLAALSHEIPFTIRESNIEHDPPTFERFRYLIPVLELPDGTLFYPPHDMRRIRACLVAMSPDHAVDA